MSKHPSGLRSILGFGAFALAFFVAYQRGISFTQALSAPFWFPDTVLLTALLLTRPSLWMVLLLATLPIRLLVDVPQGTPHWFLMATFAIDSLKAVAGAYLIRRFIPDLARLGHLREFGLFVLVAVVGIPAGAALAGAACRNLLGYGFWAAWLQWFLGNSLTHLVLTFAVLQWVPFVRRPIPSLPARRIIEGAMLLVAVSAAAFVAFSGAFAVPGNSALLVYVPVPILLWAALRFGPRGAATTLSVVASLSIWYAAQGRGPFSTQSLSENVLAIQLFLYVVGGPMLVLAAISQEQALTRSALRDSEARMGLAADAADLGFWVWDTTNDEIWMNDKRRELLGMNAPGRVTFAAFLEAVYPDDRMLFRLNIHRAIEGHDRFEGEYRVARPDGELRWIASRGRCLRNPEGTVTQLMGVSIDVTARKRAEEAMQQLTHSTRLALLGELTASIAHEINQPLSAIMSNSAAADRLLQTESPDVVELRDILADIRRDDLRASEVIRRVVALAAKRETPRAPMDVNASVEDVLQLIAADAQRRGVTVLADLARGLPPVLCDRVQIEQVLLNLVLNGMDAMDGTPSGQRSLRVRTNGESQDWVTISVTDAGHGIPADQMPRLFESFFTTKENGMGLGLALARSIAESHEGRLDAENNAGAGATFRLRLPHGSRQSVVGGRQFKSAV